MDDVDRSMLKYSESAQRGMPGESTSPTGSVDPTTVDSLITMCEGALDQLHCEITMITSVLQSALKFGYDMEVSEGKHQTPEHDCPVGGRVAHLWELIMQADQRLTHVRRSVRL